MTEFRDEMISSQGWEERQHSQARYWLWSEVHELIRKRIHSDAELGRLARSMEAALAEGSLPPSEAAQQLLAELTRSEAPPPSQS